MKVNDVEIEFLGHAGFRIQDSAGKIMTIDPYNISENAGKADIVLITHSHYDHCSIKDIESVKKEGTIVIIPADAQSKITKIEHVEMQIIEIGDELTFGNTKIEAIPAYNIDKEYHPKREGWMGYLIKINGTTIYHAGDTDKIPEMNKLTGYGKHGNEFVALLPVSGKYVMDSEEAADVASLLSPDLCIPMHYGAGVAGTLEDAEHFVEQCKKTGLKATILTKL